MALLFLKRMKGCETIDDIIKKSFSASFICCKIAVHYNHHFMLSGALSSYHEICQ